MKSLNRVSLIGNLGKDAETKYTQSGVAKTTFSIATTRSYKNQAGEWIDETDWHNVVLWRKEKLAEYLLKGIKLYVEGSLRTRSYEDRDGVKKYITEVVGEDVILLGSPQGNSGGGYKPPTGKPDPMPTQDGPVYSDVVGDDDVPF